MGIGRSGYPSAARCQVAVLSPMYTAGTQHGQLKNARGRGTSKDRMVHLGTRLVPLGFQGDIMHGHRREPGGQPINVPNLDLNTAWPKFHVQNSASGAIESIAPATRWALLRVKPLAFPKYMAFEAPLTRRRTTRRGSDRHCHPARRDATRCVRDACPSCRQRRRRLLPYRTNHLRPPRRSLCT